MTIHEPKPKDDIKTSPTSEKPVDTENTDTGEADVPKPLNLQKREYDLEATRFGDWELNGRCIDF